MMYCPSCGKPSSEDQKFCRSCGFNLHTVVQAFAGQRALVEPDANLVQMLEKFRSRRETMARRGFITMWVGIVVAALFGVTSGILANLEPSLAGLVGSQAGIGGVVLLVGIGLLIYSRFLPEVPAVGPLPQPTALPQAEPFMALPPDRRPVSASSVIEHTTELLEDPAAQPAARTTARQRE
jgi:hypothetical protein